MIPETNITAWSLTDPWAEPGQVEQDLIISQALSEIFNHELLGAELRFRGGTARVWFLYGGSRFFQVSVIQPYFRTRDPGPTPDLADSAKIHRSGHEFSIRAEILTLRAPLRPGRFRRAWVTPASGNHAPAPAARSVRTVSKARSFPAIRESHPPPSTSSSFRNRCVIQTTLISFGRRQDESAPSLTLYERCWSLGWDKPVFHLAKCLRSYAFVCRPRMIPKRSSG